ncbi:MULTISPECIES: ATP-binding protein [unclassified Acidovorax]|uniref:ATP-binding protein n=1 Tax=unclassified Acidovorax TaxID=2684926 RepID=UPI000B3FAE0A|nr:MULTISPECIES: ATP-binding protein [unclassified Acidovorax]
MTVRQRIVFLIALTFAALGGIGGYALYQSQKGAHEVKSVTEGVVPSTIQSVELMGQLKDIQIATLSMVAAPDKEAAQRAHEELSSRKASLVKALQDQSEQADSHAQRGIIKEAQDSLSNYFAAIDDTANFKRAGQQDLAEATMAATVDQYLREQGLLLDAVQLEKRRSKDEAIEALNQNLKDTSATLAVVTVVSVLGLAFIGYLLYRQIIHPIGEMEAKMTAIATSQDFTHRVPVTRQDEIGRSLMAFNTMVEKIQQSSELVRQKSADIQAMLHYIPQGILTLQSGGLIHPEFSEHLTALLERRDIAGQTVADVVFAGSNLGVDAKDQALAAIGACIGEEAMNFDFNAHLLPREIVRPQPDGSTRTWELGWSPITSEGGTIERLMLCIRDVTELRQLAHAAHAQQQELAIIGQILGMDREKFQSFIAGATAFLQANERLIGQAATNAAARPAAIDELFRNMHTIKGNARTYGLQQLTDVVHAAEQRYDQLRQDPAAWATDTLQSDLAGVREMLAIYQMVNEVKLRDRSAGAPAANGQMVAMEREQVEALALALSDAAGSDDVAALRTATAQAANALHGWVGVRLSDALSGPLASLPSLAQELDKEPPLVQVNDADIVLRHQVADMLRDVFTHLLRNSMDHGIEGAATRVSAGKPPAGSIVIDMALNEEHLQLRIADDGRGLDLERIRAKAQQAGLLEPHDAPSDEALVQLIFEPGFSTAAAVTAVSGRGVGMDAVKAFVAEHGGNVALQLRAATASTQRAFDILIHLPAQYALRVQS